MWVHQHVDIYMWVIYMLAYIYVDICMWTYICICKMYPWVVIYIYICVYVHMGCIALRPGTPNKCNTFMRSCDVMFSLAFECQMSVCSDA